MILADAEFLANLKQATIKLWSSTHLLSSESDAALCLQFHSLASAAAIRKELMLAGLVLFNDI